MFTIPESVKLPQFVKDSKQRQSCVVSLMQSENEYPKSYFKKRELNSRKKPINFSINARI